ncbi:MAG: EamA family transporter [Muribaculum sp.]|nr:EamA family transporter [Muribaculaceae bacterium]MCM1080330.1 EamA family transporter [Muribaculum sp.]
MVAQISYALYLTLYRNFIKRYSLVTLMKWMFLFATLLSALATSSTIISTNFKAITLQEWLTSGYVVLFGTFFAYILIMIGQKNLRPTVVGCYNYLQPIVATFVGISLGMEHISATKILAIILIFSGVYLVTISRSYAYSESK